jgi:hypothetical protein
VPGGRKLPAEAGRIVAAAALPGDEDPVRPEERQGQLDQLGQGGHRPRRHGRPRPAVRVARGQRLGPGRLRRDTLAQPDRIDHGREEADLLADRVDEQGPIRRQRRRQRQPGKAAAAPEIDEPVDPASPQDRKGREAVGDVADRDPPPGRGSTSG